MKNTIIITTLMLLCAASCKKDKANEDQLPPATQTGANTFGCLVNGKVWIPKGFTGTGTPNPKLSFDNYNGNTIFSINTYHYQNQVAEGFISLSLIDSNLNIGSFNYPSNMNFSIGWEQVLGSCFTPAFDTTIKKWGSARILKYDNVNNIISGNFSAKFKAPNCDTVFITEGRFDFKF